MRTRNLQLKRTILFVLLLTLVGMTNAFAQEFTVGKLKYSIIDGKSVSVTGHVDGENAKGILVIPGSVNYNAHSYSVCSIGFEAFIDCTGLTSVTIPNTITSIGYYAFTRCEGLTSVIIPNSVTEIRGEAFAYCYGLTGSLIIPNSVSFIDPNAFWGCGGFEQIIVESGNKNFDSRDNCNAIIETSTNKLILGCKNTVIPNSVAVINPYAFYGCAQLTSVNIPNSVTTIGEHAFEGCINMTSISIPSSVISVGGDLSQGNPFYNTGWYNQQPDGILYLDDCCLGCKGKGPKGELKIKNGTRLITACAFVGCKELTSVFIPSSVKFMGRGAFYYCEKLTSAIIESPYLRDLSYNAYFDYNHKVNLIYR